MISGFNEGTTKMNSNLESDIRLADRYGFERIEIRLDKLEQYLASHSLESLLELLKQHAIRPHLLNAVKDVNIATDEHSSQVRRQVERACWLAAQIGSPGVVLVPALQAGVHTQGGLEAIGAHCVRIVRSLASVASSYGVGIALEPMGLEASTIRSLDDAWRIVEQADCANVGIVLDTFNLFLFDGWRDLSCLRRIPVDRIWVVHVADCESPLPPRIDQRNRVWPGDGIIPIREIIEDLQGVGYSGVVSVELFRPEYWQLDAETVIRTAKEKADGVLEGPAQ